MARECLPACLFCLEPSADLLARTRLIRCCVLLRPSVGMLCQQLDVWMEGGVNCCYWGPQGINTNNEASVLQP